MEKNLLSIPPQKDVITLEEGMKRTRNWRDAIKQLYNNDESKIPHAIFIPLVDLFELQKLGGYVNMPGETTKYIVGIRAYFSLEDPILPQQPPTNGNQLTAVVVAVYQINHRDPNCAGEFDYDPRHPTYDLIIQVPSASQGAGMDTTGQAYSIYDITRPCPNLCDTESELYGPLLGQ